MLQDTVCRKFPLALHVFLRPWTESSGWRINSSLLRRFYVFISVWWSIKEWTVVASESRSTRGLHNQSQNYSFNKQRDTWLQLFVLSQSSCERVVLWLCWQYGAWGSVPMTTFRRWLWCKARSGDITLLLGKVDNSSGFRGCHMRNRLWENCGSGWVEYQEAVFCRLRIVYCFI